MNFYFFCIATALALCFFIGGVTFSIYLLVTHKSFFGHLNLFTTAKLG